MKIESYRDLVVWQKAMDLVIAVYELTSKFPKEEVYGITSQMRRAAISIPSNIAEGKYRGTRKDFAQFLRIAFGSGAELETQLEIARRLDLISEKEYQQTQSLLDEIMKMLNVFIGKLV